MGKLTPAGDDRADQKETGVINAPGAGPAVRVKGPTNVTISGVFTGEAVYERSFDGGITWVPCTAGGNPVVFTAPSSEVAIEPEDGVLARIRVLVLTAGSVNWRISR